MKNITAVLNSDGQKIEVIEVTGIELTKFLEDHPTMVLEEFIEKMVNFESSNIVGYIGKADTGNYWFINDSYFGANYTVGSK